MALPYLGEIRMFGGSFALQGWALCDGTILQTVQNEALFSLLGSSYGGDGRTTFGLPDLKGRVPIHQGQGVSMTNRTIGSKGGQEDVNLVEANLPSHTPPFMGTNDDGTSIEPTNRVLAKSISGTPYEDDDPNTDLSSNMILSSGGSGVDINNMQPFQVVNFIIAVVGQMPTQT